MIGRFATGLGSTLPFAAGVSEVEPRTFFAFTLPTVAVWASAIVMLGYFAGDNLATIDRILSTVGWVGVGIAPAPGRFAHARFSVRGSSRLHPVRRDPWGGRGG